jgi:hypothetical protein
MLFSPRSTFRPALAAVALAVPTSSAGAHSAPAGKHHADQRLVVRGEATARA